MAEMFKIKVEVVPSGPNRQDCGDCSFEGVDEFCKTCTLEGKIYEILKITHREGLECAGCVHAGDTICLAPSLTPCPKEQSD